MSLTCNNLPVPHDEGRQSTLKDAVLGREGQREEKFFIKGGRCVHSVGPEELRTPRQCHVTGTFGCSFQRQVFREGWIKEPSFPGPFCSHVLVKTY
jgi:hypothetical protein